MKAMYRSLLALSLVALAGRGLAQDDVSPAPDAVAPPVPADVEEPIKPPASNVPPSQYGEAAKGFLIDMRSTLTKALEILRKVRENPDAIQLTCVNDAITTMKGVMKVSEDANISLQEALATSATERANYEFSKIEVSQRKMTELYTSALNCSGSDTSGTTTSVEVEVDDSLAQPDPYYGNNSLFFEPETNIVNGGRGDSYDCDPRLPPISGVL